MASSIRDRFDERDVHPDLRPTFKEMHSLRNELEGFSGDSNALRKLQGRLNTLDGNRYNGAFVAQHEWPPFYGQTVLHSMLHMCYQLLRSKEVYMEDAETAVHSDLQHVHRDLKGIMAGLERSKAKAKQMQINRYQGMLDAIDNNRVKGAFVGVGELELKGDPKPGQGVLADLLHDAYKLVSAIQTRHRETHWDPCGVDPKLEHIHRALHSLLTQVELYHGDLEGLRKIQGRIHKIENEKMDGKFGFVGRPGESVLEGQAKCQAVLDECYEQARAKMELIETTDKAIHPLLKPLGKELNCILRDLRLCEDLAAVERFRARVKAIDMARIDDKFVPSDGKQEGHTPLLGQAVLLDRLNEAFGLISKMRDEVEGCS